MQWRNQSKKWNTRLSKDKFYYKPRNRGEIEKRYWRWSTCFASLKGSKSDLTLCKAERRIDTNIICKIYKAVKSCDIFDIPFDCLHLEILESEGKQGQYSSILMEPTYEEMQRQHIYHIPTSEWRTTTWLKGRWNFKKSLS